MKRSAIFTQERSQKGEKRGFIYAVAKYYLQQKQVGRHCAWADHYLQAVICRSRGGLSAIEKEENLQRMIRSIVFSSDLGEKSHNAFQHGPVQSIRVLEMATKLAIPLHSDSPPFLFVPCKVSALNRSFLSSILESTENKWLQNWKKSINL